MLLPELRMITRDLLGGAGRRLMLSCALSLFALAPAALLAAESPVLVQSLERQYPPWTDKGGASPTGVIVVGGGVATYLAAVKEGKTPAGPGERVLAGVKLAEHFPHATLVFTGGGEPNPVAAMARLGLASNRIVIESRSRNTAENAAFTARLVKPKPDQRWILVTSAYHMPRAMNCFEAAGFVVEAYPVDYWTNATRQDQTRREREAPKEALGQLACGLAVRLSGVVVPP